MKKFGVGCLGTIIAMVLVLSLLFIGSVITGFIIFALWNWVLIGLIGAAVPPVGFWVAWGIGLLISFISSFFTSHVTISK